jgi:hypothetical protein
VNLVNRINAFAKLGEILRNPDPGYFRSLASEIKELSDLINKVHHYNPWFTPENVKFALNAIGRCLNVSNLEKWVKRYSTSSYEHRVPKTIGVVMAGNIPLVGFHDYLSVLISGHKLVAKLSTGDDKLLPHLHNILLKIEPEFRKFAKFTDGILTGFDAIIATGSNNTARYFQFYFGKYPNIIRKNRSSLAVLTGNESDKQMANLAEDIFRYFGLGCRSVSKLFVPASYKFDRLFDAAQDYVEVINHNKYKNNYDYHKAIYLINKTPHLDNGFLMLKEDSALSSPMSVVYYERYNTLSIVKTLLQNQKDEIQCVVSDLGQNIFRVITQPGKTQLPELWDYADGKDTMLFLAGLK